MSAADNKPDAPNPTASPKPTPPPSQATASASPPAPAHHDPTRPNPDRPDETIPGGAYIVDGVGRDANGNERTDFKVSKDGRIVRA